LDQDVVPARLEIECDVLESAAMALVLFDDTIRRGRYREGGVDADDMRLVGEDDVLRLGVS
jgi:hypothetical protein